MYINKFRLTNYKSYSDSGEVEFKPGFNIIVGQNNAGKTALLEALTLQFNGIPHRTIETVPFPGAPPPELSTAYSWMVVDRQELLRIIGDNQPKFIRYPNNFKLDGVLFPQIPDGAVKFLQWILSHQKFEFGTILQRNSTGGTSWQFNQPLCLYPPQPYATGGNPLFISFRLDSQGNFSQIHNVAADQSNDVSVFLTQRLSTQIYRFMAERYQIGEYTFGHSNVLTSNAQNLPEVLNSLQANHEKFRLYNDLVHEILPQIRRIAVRPHPAGGGRVQIIVWPHDPKTMRDDVTVPLSESGTGVGQVLAILYVVMTSVHPQVIIIDEPQNFLHPGALRKLIEVLKTYPMHQYILATHSPTVISAADPQVLLMTQLKNSASTVATLNVSDARDLYSSLADIGASLSDVFGADRILWVEGATEQQCFPQIISTILKRPLMGTAIVSIRETGDLEGRDAQRVFQLYNRLSQASVLLPPAAGFVLDSECRSEARKQELRKLSQERAEFIPRRMYENYLLMPPAIAAVASEIKGFRDSPVSVQEIADLIEKKGKELDFYCKGTKAIPPNWLQGIDGARVLSEMFSELSESRVTYEKTKHGMLLTKWLVQHNPAALEEVAVLLKGILERDAQSQTRVTVAAK
jgi:hypothetical protein